MDYLDLSGLQAPTPLQPISLPAFEAAGARLLLKREELRDPLLGGNKWHKLQGHLQAAAEQGQRRLLSFGGAWSNHLHALAATGQRFGLETVGVVRGDRMTAMLEDCRRFGMRLHPVSHADYRRRDDALWQQELLRELGPAYVIPEGGGGEAGLRGFACLAGELAQSCSEPNTVLALAMGTGTTLAGLAAHLPAGCRIWGFPVLALPGIEQQLAKSLLTYRQHASFTVWHGLVDSAYGRLGAPLRQFLASFEEQQGLELDPIYTVKLLWALNHLADQGSIPPGTTVVALHSGGLQGRRGFALPDSLPAAA